MADGKEYIGTAVLSDGYSATGIVGTGGVNHTGSAGAETESWRLREPG